MTQLLLVATLLLGVGGHGASAHSAPDGLTQLAPRALPISPPSIRLHAAPSAGGVGSVIDTLDLVANRLLPGNQQPAVQASPQMVLYDSKNGNLYIRGSGGLSISVVNASTETALTSLTVGYAASAYLPNVPTMALDTANGNLYEANTEAESLGVVSTTTNLLTASINLGAAPGGIVFDPANGNLYTSNWGNNNVSVISGSSNTVVASIPVGGEPGAILYDPNDSEVYVSNFNSGNVSVIDTSTETVVQNPVTGLRSAEPLALTLNTKDDLVNVVNAISGNISVINGVTYAVQSVPVGAAPSSATYDPSKDTLLVANGGSNNVTVLQQPGNTVVGNIPIGHGAQGAVYDPVNGYVYTANYGSNNVSILDPSTNTWKGAVTTTNFPEALAVDIHTGNVFVANEGTASSDTNLTVISGSTSLSVASVRLAVDPTSLDVASNGNLYATDNAGLGADILSAATNLRTGFASSAPRPDDTAYDPATGELYIASEPSGAVTVVTGTGTLVTTIGLGFGSFGVAYDPANSEIYVSNYYSGNITLINGATHAIDKVITAKPFDSLGAEIYDPASSSIYVADYSAHNVTVVNRTSTNGSIQVGTEPTSFAYDPENDSIFVANYGSGNISVINATTNRVVGHVSGYFPQYLAYDSGTNSVYMVSSENGQVNAYNATTYALLGSPLNINDSIRSGGVAYSPSSGDIYVSNEFTSSISILSSVTVTTYPVTFIESGLTPSTTWGVTLNGAPNSSATTHIGFTEPNGNYPFTVGSVAGYVANATSGEVAVAGSPATVYIAFTAQSSPTSYPVTFNETGLPTGTQWAISLTPSISGNSPATAPASIVFNAPNASYTFTVGAVNGYSASPSSSSVVVAGHPVYQTIAFSVGTSLLSATLTADPANLSLGASTTLTTSTAGGTAPYSYVYTGLPMGCVTSSTVDLSCTPSVSGTFTVTVNVTDHAGAHALAHATLRVSSPPGTAGTSGLTAWEWAIIAGLVLLAFLLLLFFLLGRRKRAEPEPVVKAESSGPSPPPSPPGGAS